MEEILEKMNQMHVTVQYRPGDMKSMPQRICGSQRLVSVLPLRSCRRSEHGRTAVGLSAVLPSIDADKKMRRIASIALDNIL